MGKKEWLESIEVDDSIHQIESSANFQFVVEYRVTDRTADSIVCIDECGEEVTFCRSNGRRVGGGYSLEYYSKEAIKRALDELERVNTALFVKSVTFDGMPLATLKKIKKAIQSDPAWADYWSSGR